MEDDFASERRRVIQEEQAKCVSSANDPFCIASLIRMDVEVPQRGYACLPCGTTHTAALPRGFHPYCGMCGGRMATYADVTSTHGEPYRMELPPPLPAGVVSVPSVFGSSGDCPRCGQYNHPLHVCGMAEAMAAMAPAFKKAVDAMRPTVSLPSEAEATTAQLEDTQAEGEPPPSGWRDRPALL
jgi:hypothetical protein